MTKRFVPHLAALILASALAGCTLEEAPPATPSPAAPLAPVAEAPPALSPPAEHHPAAADTAPALPNAQRPTPNAPPMMGGPMAGQAPPNAPLTPTAELDKKIVETEKSADKKALAAAYAARGTFHMNDAAAGARIKYKAALADYRKALAADPANAEAKANKAMIENIYQSMGRPVPE